MKDNIKIYVARMYEFVCDALSICDKENNDYDKILKDKKNQLALTMCILQIGELANKIRLCKTYCFITKNAIFTEFLSKINVFK